MQSSKTSDTTNHAAASDRSPSVPLHVYREIAEELQATKAAIGVLSEENQKLVRQNQQLLAQNQQLRHQIQSVFESARQMQQVATSHRQEISPIEPPEAEDAIADPKDAPMLADSYFPPLEKNNDFSSLSEEAAASLSASVVEPSAYAAFEPSETSGSIFFSKRSNIIWMAIGLSVLLVALSVGGYSIVRFVFPKR